MSTPLHNIHGIGPKTEEKLKKLGMVDVETLAATKLDQFSHVPNLKTWVQRAQKYLSMTQTSLPLTVNIPTDLSTAYQTLIETHSWWELEVNVPCEYNGELIMQRVILYELSINSDHRVSIVCSYISPKDNTSLCTISYSPQLIFFFNPTVSFPTLTISLPKPIWTRLSNKRAIASVLWEMNILVNKSERLQLEV